jgi:hypothetical protein
MLGGVFKMSEKIVNSSESMAPQNYEVLEPPVRQIVDGSVVDVYLIKNIVDDKGEPIKDPVAYVVTNPDTLVQWHGEFSGEPTGEYSAAGRVTARIGRSEIYHKSVRKDLPLWGLRMAVAKKRATRLLKKTI